MCDPLWAIPFACFAFGLANVGGRSGAIARWMAAGWLGATALLPQTWDAHIKARLLLAEQDIATLGVPLALTDYQETLDWIDRGVISATVTQKPYVMSYYGLKFLDDLHHNAVHQFKDWRTALAPPMPISADTGTVIVDKNNLKVYREGLATHPKPP